MARITNLDPNKSCSSSKYCPIQQFLISAALQQISLVRYYIEVKKYHPDTTIEGKPTALCYAALKRDSCLMQYLVIHGADVNKRDGMGMAPIHYATLGGCTYCLSYLVHSGAQINIESKNGRTPLSLCIGNPCLNECSELLRRYGAGYHSQISNPSSFH